MLDISWLAGHAKTNYTHHTSPITLATKSGSKTSFSDLVKETTPPCRLNPLLFNGHLQTMYTAVKDPGPPIHYKRHIFESTFSVYPGQFAVDFAIPPPSSPSTDSSLPERTTYYSEEEFGEIDSTDDTPMLVCLHGLSGGSYEVYLRQVVAPVTAAGWECCVVNGRGCALAQITSPHLFNARATWDIRQTVHWLRKTFPNRPLYGIGFSLGANIITNYIAEEGENCEFKAAVACSNPWNLEISHQDLKRSWIGDNVYSKVMGQNLKKLFELHKDVILKNPDIDYDKVKAASRLYEFDR
jgi:predicted alpha/beta-fold hydrolase